MQNYIVIIFIFGMMMQVPVRRLNMQFDIAGPQSVADLYFSFFKIGSLVLVVPAGVNNLYRLPIGTGQFFRIEMLKLPDILKKIFLHTAGFIKEVKTNITN